MGASINGWFNGASFVARILSGILADIIATDVVLMVCIWTNALSIPILWTFAKSFPLYLIFSIIYGISFSGTSTVTPVIVANYYGNPPPLYPQHRPTQLIFSTAGFCSFSVHLPSPLLFVALLYGHRSRSSFKCAWDCLRMLLCGLVMWIFDQWADLGDD
jgi:MFS family permease